MDFQLRPSATTELDFACGPRLYLDMTANSTLRSPNRRYVKILWLTPRLLRIYLDGKRSIPTPSDSTLINSAQIQLVHEMIPEYAESHPNLHEHRSREANCDDEDVKKLTVVSPWARGDPPPQGSLSSRFLAMAIDREGGKSTSAASPLKGIMETCRRHHRSKACRATRSARECSMLLSEAS
jgi:hypothetical protein